MKSILLSGYLRMMRHAGTSPVQYTFSYVTYADELSGKKPGKCETTIPDESPICNLWVGKVIRLEFSGKIRCVDCGRPTNKSFGQGSCFPCFQSLARNDYCIVKPELCHYHLGTCREPAWGEKNCFKSHTLYFANSSGLKVGITKENPIEKRWVDQGAVQGIPVATVNSRKEAGILEKHLTQFLPDKTAWQKMITETPLFLDLAREREKFLRHLDSQEFTVALDSSGPKPLTYQKSTSPQPTEITYPISSYPKKAKTLKPNPTLQIEEPLLGIKGQYLLFASGAINLRSYEGYAFALSVKE